MKTFEWFNRKDRKLRSKKKLPIRNIVSAIAILFLQLNASFPAVHAADDKTKEVGAKELEVGDKAPEFSLQAQDGSTVSLKDFLGKRAVVLYFYPKDDKLVCKKEACLFRDSYQQFVDHGAEVIGVSSDSLESHKKFVAARNLQFKLLSDRGGQVRKLYHVPRAAAGLLPGRETFVIDRDGVVRLKFNSLMDAPAHIAEALKVLKQLESAQN